MQALVLDAEWDPRSDYNLSEKERTDHRAHDSSAIWRDPELHLEERERPEPAADEVLVKVVYAGVCGSDVSMIETDDEEYMHYSAYTALPNVVGHEFSGEVVETGADAHLFEEGDLVTAEVTDDLWALRDVSSRRARPLRELRTTGVHDPGGVR